MHIKSRRRVVSLMGTCALLGSLVAQGAARPTSIVQRPVSRLPIISRVEVPKGPAWLEVGYGSVWVSKSESRLVLRIDPKTNQVIATIPVGSNAGLGIGVGLGSIWIPDTTDHTLTRIDPNTNHVVRTYSVNFAAEPEGSIGVGLGSIWLLTNDGNTDSGTLSRLDPESGNIVAEIPVKPKSHAVLVAFNAVWVTSGDDGTVTRVDPDINAVTTEIRVHPKPLFLAEGAGSVWVMSQGDGTLARIDPTSNAVIATIDVGVPGVGGDLTIADGYAWVSAEGVPLSQIDCSTNRVLRQFVGGKLDDTLRVGFGAAWIVDESHGQIWKVSLKRLSHL